MEKNRQAEILGDKTGADSLAMKLNQAPICLGWKD
jgi:hypothetical protein